VRTGKITRSLAEQRASVPEELSRLLGGAPVSQAEAGMATASAPPPVTIPGG
jgi:hypothetical protein